MQVKKTQGRSHEKSERTFVHGPMTVGDFSSEVGDFGGAFVLSTFGQISPNCSSGKSPIAPPAPGLLFAFYVQEVIVAESSSIITAQ